MEKIIKHVTIHNDTLMLTPQVKKKTDNTALTILGQKIQLLT